MRKTVLCLLAISLAGFSGIASADQYLQQRIQQWKPICADRDKALRYVECHRPPGSVRYTYEMTGSERQYSLEQGQKAVGMRQRATTRDGSNDNRRVRRR